MFLIQGIYILDSSSVELSRVETSRGERERAEWRGSICLLAYLPVCLSVRLVELDPPTLFLMKMKDGDGDGVFHIVVEILPNVESISLRS